MPYQEARNVILTGDLLLCSGNQPLPRMIQAVSRSSYSHVAMVVRMLSVDRLLLLEAGWPYGVRAVPFSSYFKDWKGSGKPYFGNLLLARHSAINGDDTDTMTLFMSELVNILGRPYSLRRVLRIGAREVAALAGLYFPALQLKKAMVCSEYIVQAYARLGIEIPWNNKGSILPMDIATHREISLVCRIQ